MYKYAIGEIGNEHGHESVKTYETEMAAERAAKRAVRIYRGDGWYRVYQV